MGNISMNTVAALLRHATTLQASVVAFSEEPAPADLKLLQQLVWVADLAAEDHLEWVADARHEFLSTELLATVNLDGAPQWVHEMSEYWITGSGVTEVNLARLKVFIAETYERLVGMAADRLVARAEALATGDDERGVLGRLLGDLERLGYADEAKRIEALR